MAWRHKKQRGQWHINNLRFVWKDSGWIFIGRYFIQSKWFSGIFVKTILIFLWQVWMSDFEIDCFSPCENEVFQLKPSRQQSFSTLSWKVDGNFHKSNYDYLTFYWLFCITSFYDFFFNIYKKKIKLPKENNSWLMKIIVKTPK